MKQIVASLFSIFIFHCQADLWAHCWVLKLSCLTVDLNLKVNYELSLSDWFLEDSGFQIYFRD